MIFVECFKRIISHFVIGREKSDADLNKSALGIGLLWLIFLNDRVGLLKEPKHTLPSKNQCIWKGIWKKLKYKHCEGIEGVSGNGSPVITVWQQCPYCFRISLCHDIIFFWYVKELMFIMISVIHLILILVEVLKHASVRHNMTLKNSIFF